jgi:hypothetical protein
MKSVVFETQLGPPFTTYLARTNVGNRQMREMQWAKPQLVEQIRFD